MNDAARAAKMWILAWALLHSPATAQTAQTVSGPGISDRKIQQLCNVVNDQILSQKGLAWLEKNDGKGLGIPIGVGMYGHEAIISDAAGVVASDSREVIRTKIQKFWLANRDRLSCSLLGFSIRKGNIAKLAIERNSKDVMNDFIRRWNLDLNFIDKADGRTVLDYVEDELKAAQGTGLEPILRRYRELISRAGAKRGAELR